MSADELVELLTQALFVLIFAHSALRAIRRPRRASLNVALFFGAAALIVVETWLLRALGTQPTDLLNSISSSLLMALPYLLLRLVDDIAGVAARLMRGAEVGLALAVIGIFVLPQPLPGWLAALYILYFVGLAGYAAAICLRAAARATGVTRRRLQAVSAGSGLLGLLLLLVGAQLALPGLAPVWTAISRLASLGAGLAYVLGFAPPIWLRRAWQEPELRAFLGRASHLPRLPNTSAIVAELEHGAAAAIGAPGAAIGLWDPEAARLRFHAPGREFDLVPDRTIGGRAFTRQEPMLSTDAARDDPDHADLYRGAGARAILAAPISAGGRRLGVLTVFAPRAPIFADDDLTLVALLADQAAVILESRALIDEAARVQALEHATRLKDDFLSAAAHELKTPLTTLVAQAQLLERRARRDPAAPPDLDGIRRIDREAKRLRLLVLELLDAARVEPGQLLGRRETIDLARLVREVSDRQAWERHRCTLDLVGDLTGQFDPFRLTQLAENLLENAVKYSPEGGEVIVRGWRDGDHLHLTVTDQGIGVPAGDLPHIFERFYRATNVDDRRYAGMGLGLYICRGIVEEHGGHLWATPGETVGTSFHVELPAQPLGPAT